MLSRNNRTRIGGAAIGGFTLIELLIVVEIFDEDGALSRAFLQRRGFCCENGCKNCPYGFRKRSRVEEEGDA